MLLASKLRESKPLSAEMLVFYTDHSITLEDLWVSEIICTTRKEKKRCPSSLNLICRSRSIALGVFVIFCVTNPRMMEEKACGARDFSKTETLADHDKCVGARGKSVPVSDKGTSF